MDLLCIYTPEHSHFTGSYRATTLGFNVVGVIPLGLISGSESKSKAMANSSVLAGKEQVSNSSLLAGEEMVSNSSLLAGEEMISNSSLLAGEEMVSKSSLLAEELE